MNSFKMRIAIVLLVASSCAVSQENSYRFTLDSVDAHIMMKLQTVAPVPCLGSTIRTETRQIGDTVVVITSGFIRPTPCLDGVAPATARISLGRQPKAVFVLSIREETAEDLWVVSRTSEGFSVTPVRHAFTTFSQ